MPIPKKVTLKHLMVLRECIENDWAISATTGLTSVHRHHFCSYPDGAQQGDYDWFKDNRCDHVVSPLIQWGFLYVAPKPKVDDRGRRGKFAWYEQPYAITDKAREYWETTGRDLYDQLKAKEDAKRQEVERLAIIKERNSRYSRSRRNAGMLVKITKETDKRVYIEPVEMHTSEPVTSRTMGAWTYYEGSGKNLYCSKDQIYRDNVSHEQFRRIVSAEDQIISEMNDLNAQEEIELKEIRERYQERRKQKEAEWAEIRNNAG